VSHIKPSVQARARLADIGDGPAHICAGTGTGLAPATSAPGLGWPLPHLHRDWAHPDHICAGTAATPQLRSLRYFLTDKWERHSSPHRRARPATAPAITQDDGPKNSLNPAPTRCNRSRCAARLRLRSESGDRRARAHERAAQELRRCAFAPETTRTLPRGVFR
jgi:hypothetical protein